MKPLYDLSKSFTENITDGPFYDGPFFLRSIPAREEWHTLFDVPVMSRIGVAACPLTATPKGIKLMSRLGYDIINYKTVASSFRPPHPHPNVGMIDNNSVPQESLLDVPMVRIGKNSSALSFVNSIGNPSFDLETVCAGIRQAKNILLPGQLLIVSIFGVESPTRSLADDFAYLAQRVKEAGAQVVEADISCPNVSCGVLSNNADLVYEITRKIVSVLGDTPLTFKVGAYNNKEIMNDVFCAAARAGARGITGINTIRVRAVDAEGQSFFGPSRLISGLSGAPIFSVATNFVREAQNINQKKQLGLTIIGTGGILTANDFETMLSCGADVAMSATGAMWYPDLAMNYHQMKENKYGTFVRKNESRETTL
jgi:dihydroorotate dehydrogenase